MTSVYLIRHAQALGNIEQRFQGHIDHPLTEKGEYQARLLTRRMSALPLSAVYTSPLKRAYATAEPIAKNHRLEPIIHKGLIEIDGGKLENQLFTDLYEKYPKEFRAFNEEPHLFLGVGGESIEQVYNRMRDAMLEIAEENRGKTIAVVSHGCAIRCFLCFALGYPLEKLGTLSWSGNTNVSHILFDDSLSIHVPYHSDETHMPASMRGAYASKRL